MPYSIDKKNKCVYKKKSDGTRGAKVGCTKGSIQKYVAALHANVDEQKKALQEMKKAITENENIVEAPVELASNIEFFVVEKSKDPMDDPNDLVFASDPISFANQIRGGLLPEDVVGFYLSEDEALNAAHDQVQAVYEAARGLEDKKNTVTEKINKAIDRLQKEVNMHMKASRENPLEAEGHDTQAANKMMKIKELRAKHKMVEGSKKQLEKDEEKTKLDEAKAKKAKKDYDKDGKIETPAQEYKGSKDKAIKKAQKTKK